jgi:hypothetical protein
LREEKCFVANTWFNLLQNPFFALSPSPLPTLGEGQGVRAKAEGTSLQQSNFGMFTGFLVKERIAAGTGLI